MYAVEGAGQDKIVVGVELLESWREVAVVDQPSGLVDDEQCKDDPASRVSVRFPWPVCDDILTC
jgi:hypothetical protein